MILHRLIRHHLKHGDDRAFYELQARDAVRWMRTKAIDLGPSTNVLDLGCGHGVFGGVLIETGCNVTFADEANYLFEEFQGCRFVAMNLDGETWMEAGEYDLVVCSNVYEHLSKPDRFLKQCHRLLKPGGFLYLSWTNWLSPWGGHEFSPFHYLGPKWGPRIFDRFTGKTRKHTPYVNLFPTSIGKALRRINQNHELHIRARAPRYFTECSPILRIPLLREFLSWNCALFIQRRGRQEKPTSTKARGHL